MRDRVQAAPRNKEQEGGCNESEHDHGGRTRSEGVDGCGRGGRSWHSSDGRCRDEEEDERDDLANYASARAVRDTLLQGVVEVHSVGDVAGSNNRTMASAK